MNTPIVSKKIFNHSLIDWFKLVTGLIAFGTGLSLMVLAKLGNGPWEAFHQGVANHTGVAMGTVSIGFGVFVLLLWIPLKQKPGIGTFANMVGLGLIMNAMLDAFSPPENMGLRWTYMLIGLFICGLGIGLYISAHMGPGPRDGLMTGIAGNRYPIWLVRGGIEATVLIFAWLLGGTIGIGTLLFAVCIGPLVHYFLILFGYKHQKEEEWERAE